MEATKEQVIRLFLSFLSRYVPIGQAQLATLGGRGLEAKLWSELNVPTEHGWLIERNRQRAGDLISTHRYGTHNQLRTFDRILAGHGEARAYIDGFHLDLCGTMSNAAIQNFSPVLPLVLKSTGCCLAITVADQRRNLVLEQWPSFRARGKRLFGSQASTLYDQLVAQQRCVPVRQDASAFFKPFDAAKAAKREFGLLIEMAELLRVQQLPWVPVLIERYIYVSRYKRQPFRMRTYFFHFGQQTPSCSELAFAQAWVGSKLFFANATAFAEVSVPPVGTAVQPIAVQPATKGSETKMENTSRLNELVRVLGGDIQAEYTQLLADSQQLSTFRALLDAARGTSIANGHAPQAQASPEPPHTAQAQPRSPRRAKKTWADLSQREQLEWAIKALEMRDQLNGKFTNGPWEKFLKADFGYYSKEARLQPAFRHCPSQREVPRGLRGKGQGCLRRRGKAVPRPPREPLSEVASNRMRRMRMPNLRLG